MKSAHLETIRRSFSAQAAGFESRALHFTKESYLNAVLTWTAPNKQDAVLEVAAGTCACGRAFAPQVQSVVCLDATSAMLEVGKQEAGRSCLDNMVFVEGCAEELPFEDNSFDIVLSRLAFHHFAEVKAPFSEMVRVLKSGGKLVMIDMEAAEEALRVVEDEIETLRDPSHVKNLSKAEMLYLFTSAGLALQKCETTQIRQNVESWLALPKTPASARTEILQRMQAEIEGGQKTGFSPYRQDGSLYFHQRWVFIMGKKAGSYAPASTCGGCL